MARLQQTQRKRVGSVPRLPVDVVAAIAAEGRWERSIQISSSSWKGKSLFVLINKLILAGVVFHVWQERNRRLFQSKRKQFWQVVADVEDDVRKKLQGLAVVKTSRVREELSRWGIVVE
ncbi:hypothetical protein AgCh_017086 [Apium graveolens]